MIQRDYDIVIIGAGPAGIAAAIQLKRTGIDFQILEKDRIGGLLWHANFVENYPGFPSGVSGPDLVKCFKLHLKQLNIEVQKTDVKKVKYLNKEFFLR